jgi:hypothetical protein
MEKRREAQKEWVSGEKKLIRSLPNTQQGLRIFDKYLFHETHNREVTATFLSTFFSDTSEWISMKSGI